MVYIRPTLLLDVNLFNLISEVLVFLFFFLCCVIMKMICHKRCECQKTSLHLVILLKYFNLLIAEVIKSVERQGYM